MLYSSGYTRILYLLVMAMSSITFVNAQLPDLNFINFTEEDGLSDNSVTCLMQGQQGFLWVGTIDGLNRYDGYTFKKYDFDKGDSVSRYSNLIGGLFQDKEGIIWVLGSGKDGLARFDPVTETFTVFKNDPDNAQSIPKDRLASVYEDTESNLWIGTVYGGICLMNRDGDTFQCWKPQTGDTLNKNQRRSNTITSITQDDKNEKILWLGTNYGLYQFDKNDHQFEWINYQPEKEEQASHIRELQINKDETIWISTWNGSIYLLDRKTGRSTVFKEYLNKENTPLIIRDIEYKSPDELWIASQRAGFGIFNQKAGKPFFYSNDPLDKNTIAGETCYTLLKDQSNVLWVGLDNGLTKIEPRSRYFDHYDLPCKLSEDTTIVWTRVIKQHPTENKIYIGTVWGDGLYILDRETNSIKTIPYISPPSKHNWHKEILHQPIDIEDLLFDWSGKLWIAATGGLFFYNQQTEKIEPFISPNNKTDLSRITAKSLLQDQNQNIWVGTDKSGVLKINPHNQKIIHYKHHPDKPDGLIHNSGISSLTEDPSGKIWIATIAGLSILEPKTEKFSNYHYTDYDGVHLYRISAFEQANHKLWVSSAERGLSRIEHTTLPIEKIRSYTVADGLPDNRINGIAKDRKGNLWLGTTKGLCRYNQNTKTIKTFDHKDGLKFDNIHVVNALPSGEIVIGNSKELTLFHPDSLYDYPFIPPTVLTSFKVYEEEMKFDKEINFIDKIDLSYEQNYFSLGFAALNYIQSEKNQYQYILEGYDKKWTYTGTRRQANYTNVSPGSYTFKVKGSNNDGIWNEEGKSIKIVIHPPWWRSNLAYIFYILSGLFLIVGLYRFQLSRQIARSEARRLKELDHVKNRLYTNITHEFRTPLTVISGMADKIKEQPKEWFLEGSRMIKRNSTHLLNLVNQMLDLAKLESNSLPVHKIQGNIIPYLKYLMESFHSYAKSKNITLHFSAETDHINMDYDPQKTLNILSNLLTNAIKFTPENGNIYLEIKETKYDENQGLQIQVRDTGVGIAEDKLPYIFDRFYQIDGSHTREGEGTGIGLALTRELVKLLSGRIDVSSEEGKGTVFTVVLPIEEKAEKASLDDQVTISDKTLSLATLTEKSKNFNIPSDDPDSKQPLLLIIEDSVDVVQYLRACLEGSYRLEVAQNGLIGIEKALDRIPDIIISDVMMPEKDGFEVCDTLKNDERTSHIPIILLTAKADVESKITGLKRGADVYLAKPFNPEELEVRLRQLILLRRKLQERYVSLVPDKPAEDEGHQIEDAFIRKVREIIMEHISDTELDVFHLAQKLAMSRSQLFRKIKALTDKSPSGFIRTVRLYHAKELIKTTALNISEIAYDVGFSDPAYFSKQFRRQFGETPSTYRENRF